ncbi:hypothetical protein [Marinimicrobium agarilyticum]|uniref:hypothetical protein n=1 Tax=Marinimicrobium agarilyticum TaxID=306546 RepID=UPI000483CE62|nr:hypothetical protein [Marinimicrobium agarilyticum]
MAKRESVELVLEGAEIALKQCVEDSVLKDVPFVGTLVKLYGIGGSIRDRLYAAKINRFLFCLSDVSMEQKDRMKESISAREMESDKLSQKILLALETQTDVEKSEVIANLFIAYLDRKISFSNFRRAIDVTANCFLDDLNEFLKRDGFQGFMQKTFEELEREKISGLTNTPLIGIDRTSPDELRRERQESMVGVVLYETTDFSSIYLKAYHYGKECRT